MKAFFLLALSFLGLSGADALARPVSYADGWMVMLMNDLDRNAAELNYSPTARYAIGGMHEFMRDDDYHVTSATLNIVARRWNMPGSQANFYINSGAGLAYDGDDTEPAAFTSVQIDWENRRYFTLYENRFFYAGDLDTFVKHTARVGIAPYIGDAGHLHTWLMVQADYQPGEKDDFSLTPLVRFFKDDNLLEAGYNTDGAVLFNYTKQF
jgi:hypothetical protein